MPMIDTTINELKDFNENEFNILFLTRDAGKISRTYERKINYILDENQNLKILKIVSNKDNIEDLRNFKIKALPSLVILKENKVIAKKTLTWYKKVQNGIRSDKFISEKNILEWINSFVSEEE